ncbi:MAG TPA: hypothetical protein VNN15_04005, partial [Solirubrobacterales bacterium]|nr:hypothetical protein [Solirubrobacterales bacterium]
MSGTVDKMWRAAALALFLALASLGVGLLTPSADAAGCPNEAFRTGPSAALPDCRAYELVTPPDSNGRYLESLQKFGFEAMLDFFPTELTSPSGESVVYETFQSPLLAPPGGNGNADLYEAVRGSSGWTTARRLSPSGEQAVLPILGGVSSDHAYTFTHVSPVPGFGPPRVGGS